LKKKKRRKSKEGKEEEEEEEEVEEEIPLLGAESTLGSPFNILDMISVMYFANLIWLASHPRALVPGGSLFLSRVNNRKRTTYSLLACPLSAYVLHKKVDGKSVISHTPCALVRGSLF